MAIFRMQNQGCKSGCTRKKLYEPVI
uniref:Uncharacterized protein n=1 Tax=Arundo donax TaxID=35708 RepID=A0A0A9AUH1_ARUDO